MKVAILHYHLQPGGVTTVIRNARRALAGEFEVSVLADFDYNQEPARSRAQFLSESRALARALAVAIRDADILHTHNIALGKHPRLACAVKMLVEKSGIKLINQVHDFPEENRPAQLRALRYCTGKRDDEFWKQFCYFDAPTVLWATLTSADKSKLAARGVPRDKIHVLPDPVDDVFFSRPPPEPAQADALRKQIAAFAREHNYPYYPRRKLLLSPMKVMARKNNAEAVDLVKRLGKGYQLLISLDASSPRDRAYSERLKRRIRRKKLSVVIGFGATLDNPLPQFHLAHAILTTSKVEGFGYTFVEGWLCNKLVFGRDIPDVTRDFAAEGLDLRHLYTELTSETVQNLKKLLAKPPKKLITKNRKAVLDRYSLRAYATRFKKIVAAFR